MDDAAATDLDALVRRVDPDRWMSSRFIADARARADVIALYAFDHELARAPKVASNPLIGEIRLAWWGEALDEVFGSSPVRHHPTAEALAEMARRRGLARAALEGLIDARYRELDPLPMDQAEALTWARETGGQVAVIAAGLLDPTTEVEAARAAGAAWALSRRPDQPSEDELVEARRAVRRLSARAFPAAAHAALLGHAAGSELSKRLRLTLAVARGRI